jgi:hypothetical protein
LPWLGTQPEGPAQGPAHPPLGSLGAPRRPGQRENLTCQVLLLGPRAHLAAPVIGKLANLVWMHVIHPPLFSRWQMAHTVGRQVAICRAPNEIAFTGGHFRFSVTRAS